jgi:hypothetical protein
MAKANRKGRHDFALYVMLCLDEATGTHEVKLKIVT